MAQGEPDLVAFGGVRPGQRVLDMACGRGRAAEALVAAGARVVLCDRSADALAAIGPALRSRAAIVRGDAREAPFAAASFDCVVLRAVVHHLAEPAVALREAARVAKPGGAVLLVDKTAPEDLTVRALRNAVERLRHPRHTWTYSERELRTLAGAARLDVEAWEPWSEERDAEEWIAKGDCPPPWDERVREYLRADLAAKGRALGTLKRADGALAIRETWASLRLRKAGSAR